MGSNNLIVTKHDPVHNALALGLLVLLIIGCTSLGFWYGRGGKEPSLQELLGANADLKAELLRLQQEHAKVVRESYQDKRDKIVDSKAKEQVELWAQKLQSQVFDLKEEVDLYKSILEDSSDAGIKINRFNLMKTPIKNQFEYRLLLSNSSAEAGAVNGKAIFQIAGLLNGVKTKLDLNNSGSEVRPKFNFKFFQEITGKLILPEAFVPQEVIVAVELDNSGAAVLNRSFVWQIKEDTNYVPKTQE